MIVFVDIENKHNMLFVLLCGQHKHVVFNDYISLLCVYSYIVTVAILKTCV